MGSDLVLDSPPVKQGKPSTATHFDWYGKNVKIQLAESCNLRQGNGRIDIVTRAKQYLDEELLGRDRWMEGTDRPWRTD